jgi:hypothetical protein
VSRSASSLKMRMRRRSLAIDVVAQVERDERAVRLGIRVDSRLVDAVERNDLVTVERHRRGGGAAVSDVELRARSTPMAAAAPTPATAPPRRNCRRVEPDRRAPIGRSHQLLGVGVGVMSMCMSPPS